MAAGAIAAKRTGKRRAGGVAWIACACLAAAAMLLSLAPQAVARTAFVTNHNGDEVVPLDLATGAVGLPIPVGDSPLAIAITPDGEIALVGSRDAGEVTPIDLATGVAGTPIAIESPRAIAITPDGQTALVGSEGSSEVTPVDLASGASGSPVAVGIGPVAIAITPDGESAYVANYSSDSVTPIDLTTGTAAAEIPVGEAPIAIQIAPDGGTAYVLLRNAGEIVPIDLESDLPGVPIDVGPGVYAIAISPDGAMAYVAMEATNAVTPVDLGTGTAEAPIPVGVTPAAIAISPDGETAYTANANGDDVTPIDLASGTAGASIAVGPRPLGIAIPPIQSPRAIFAVTPAPAGQPTRFDASASTAEGALPIAYEWDFGDGGTLTTTAPIAEHAYARPGAYAASLTVANECAPNAIFGGTAVFTGQTAYCNGPVTDRASHPVQVPEPSARADCPQVDAAPRNFRPARRVEGRRVPGVRAQIVVSSPAQLRIGAKLSFRRNGRSRVAAFGHHTLGNAGARNLRLPLPRALRRELPLGTRVRLTLTIDSATGCGPAQRSRRTIRTRVVNVLAARRGGLVGR